MSALNVLIVAAFFCVSLTSQANYAFAAMSVSPIIPSHNEQPNNIKSRPKTSGPSGLTMLSGTSPNGIYHRVNNSPTIGGPAKTFARGTQAIDGATVNRKR